MVVFKSARGNSQDEEIRIGWASPHSNGLPLKDPYASRKLTDSSIQQCLHGPF